MTTWKAAETVFRSGGIVRVKWFIPLLLCLLLVGPRVWSTGVRNLGATLVVSAWSDRPWARPEDVCAPVKGTERSRVTAAIAFLEQIPGNHPRIAYLRGLAYCLAGRGETALQAWHQALRSDPHFLPAAFYLALVTFGKGHVAALPAPDKVAAMAKARASEEDPEVAESWYRLAFAYWPDPQTAAWLANRALRREDKEEAKRVWQKAAARWPVTHPYHWQALAEQALLEGKRHLAAQYYAQAAYRSPRNAAYTLYLRAGDLWLQAKRPNLAVRAYHHALDMNPAHVDAYLRLGHLYRRQKAYEEAASWYRRAAKIAPQRHEPFYYLGLLYREQRLYAQALRQFERALALRPRAAGILYDKAITLAAMDRRPEAVVVLAQAIEVHPNPPQKWRDTMAWWQKYPRRRLDPDYWWQRGQQQERYRLWRTAARFYHQGAQVAKPPDDYRLLLREALMWRYLRQNAKARRIYLDLVDRYPDQMAPYMNLGDMARGERDWEQAMLWYRRALTVAPAHDTPWYFMAITAYSAGWYQAALEYIQRALHYRPDNPTYLYYKAVALKALGRTAEALSSLRQALQHHPNPPPSWKNLLERWEQEVQRGRVILPVGQALPGERACVAI